MKPVRKHQRGLSLVEALVAFAVASIGMMALVATESGLRVNADLTRQRAEAVRLAHQALEHARAFDSVDALRGAADETTSLPAGAASNTAFSLQSRYAVDGAALDADIAVTWSDRRGQPASVRLQSIVAAVDPAVSGALVARGAAGTAHLPHGRALAVPPQAVDLGDGHSRFDPPGAAGIGWIFDNRSGEVTSVCSAPAAGAAPASADRCAAAHGVVLSGYVRFSSGDEVTAGRTAPRAVGPLNLDMSIVADGGNATCFDDAGTRTAQDRVTFHCLVAFTPGRTAWSGRLDVTPLGWTVGDQASQYRVCRYSADLDGRDGVSNDEHPLQYREVSSALAHQNFLIVPGDTTCPADGSVERRTVEQAPHATETPRG